MLILIDLLFSSLILAFVWSPLCPCSLVGILYLLYHFNHITKLGLFLCFHKGGVPFTLVEAKIYYVVIFLIFEIFHSSKFIYTLFAWVLPLRTLLYFSGCGIWYLIFDIILLLYPLQHSGSSNFCHTIILGVGHIIEFDYSLWMGFSSSVFRLLERSSLLIWYNSSRLFLVPWLRLLDLIFGLALLDGFHIS